MKHVNNSEIVRPKRTRSISLGIHLSFVIKLLFIFLGMDAILLWDELWPLLEAEGRRDYTALISAAMEVWPVLLFQAVMWLGTLLFGARGIRHRLRSLDQLTSATSILSARQASAENFEVQFHDLESAIDNITPTKDDARLHTGNKELAGLEQAVNKLLDRMRDSYRQQARFVSDASHELRTPIAVIQGYANMLDRWGKSDEKVLTESIEAIKSESEHMKHLVEQLLFLARGDSGRTPLRFEAVDLSLMMKEVFEESEMIDPNHRYELKTSGSVLTQGDPEMLKQTARILIENAVKFTPKGETIILKAEYRGDAPAFTVQDCGIGMAQGDIPHIFQRFYRADHSRTRESGGTGLGLAIAKWIVDKHGGWFEVLSREDIGTRISVCLKR